MIKPGQLHHNVRFDQYEIVLSVEDTEDTHDLFKTLEIHGLPILMRSGLTFQKSPANWLAEYFNLQVLK